MDSHVYPGASRNANSASPTKKCKDCRAMLPLNMFGLAKLNKDGRCHSCNLCTQQYKRLFRQKHYKSKSQYDDSLIRSVHNQNNAILDTALTTEGFKCIGFIPHTNHVFNLDFGRSRYDMKSVAIFNRDGQDYQEYVYSGVPIEEAKTAIAKILKIKGIRLELHDVYMIASKNQIYGL